MQNAIAEEGIDPFSPKKSTRWMELKKLASVLIEFVTSANSDGLDIYFLNRAGVTGVKDVSGLQSVFSALPMGSTPLISAISRIIVNTPPPPVGSFVLLIVVTDGEPTDGSRMDLFNVLQNKPSYFHISFAECTDNAEDMEYLDQWDGVIQNFDNTDDYREELNRIQQIQGSQFKFDYTDYVIKILLATFIRYYFNLDQTKVTSSATATSSMQRSTQNSSYNYIPQQQQQRSYAPQYQQQQQTYRQDAMRADKSCCTIL